MAEIGSYLILLAMCAAAAGASGALFALWLAEERFRERAARFSAICVILAGTALAAASGLLVAALVRSDFSFEYVWAYTDKGLPLFYRATAFWAGQAGSFLFWGLMTALTGSIFVLSNGFRSFSSQTRLWFQLIFLTIIAFFCLMLDGGNSPFKVLAEIPADGRGMNPLLQNPGMVIHPPLLFLGYAIFTVPGCLALAALLVPEETKRWHAASRPYALLAWLFLSAGIVLGAWWAYMELGWGGYWAWDPVENASVLPWLTGTAALHLGLLESRRGKGHRAHAFFMGLTTVAAFFATWLVRGNVVQSVHAYAESGVGGVFLTFVTISFLFCCLVCFGSRPKGTEFGGLESREGFILMTAAVMTTLGAVIMLATLWPVITALAGGRSVGLDAGFYNRVCLPMLTVVLGLLILCTRVDWSGRIRGLKKAIALIALFIASMFGATLAGMDASLPILGAGTAVTALAAMALLAWERGAGLMSIAIHAGFALMALGVAFSGPYSAESDVSLAKGASAELKGFTITLNELYEGTSPSEGFRFLEAELSLKKNGKDLGIVAPQRRIYAKYPQNAYSEAATRFSLGDEFYATFLGVDENNAAALRVSVHPLVNWIWIGGTLMCLAPLLSVLGSGRRRKEA